jgi:multiple sugar transport system substrate-binding protein
VIRARLQLPLVAAILVLATGLNGCVRPGADDRTVVFWAMGSEADAADALLDGFRASHPDIPVRVQRVPWSAAHEKLLTAYVGGSMPDVFQLGNTWIAEMVALGALEPLDARPVERGDYFPGALAPNVVGGRLVALPWYVDTRLLFYRRDLLAAAGISEAPRTWEEWKAAMRGLKGRHYGVFLAVDEWQTPVILALQLGASLLREGDTFGNFRSPEVKRAFAFYASLFSEGLAPTRSEAQLASLYREFAAGYFAFFVTGPWNLAEFAERMPPELADAWATAPMPAPLANGAPGLSVAGGASLALSSSSRRKDDAWAVVDYLTSTAVQKEFRARSGDLPSRRSAWEGAPPDARAAAFRVQLEHMAPTPAIPEWERIASKITLHLEQVVRGDVPLDDALAALDRDVDAILEKRRSLLASGAKP